MWCSAVELTAANDPTHPRCAHECASICRTCVSHAHICAYASTHRCIYSCAHTCRTQLRIQPCFPCYHTSPHCPPPLSTKFPPICIPCVPPSVCRSIPRGSAKDKLACTGSGATGSTRKDNSPCKGSMDVISKPPLQQHRQP